MPLVDPKRSWHMISSHCPFLHTHTNTHTHTHTHTHAHTHMHKTIPCKDHPRHVQFLWRETSPDKITQWQCMHSTFELITSSDSCARLRTCQTAFDIRMSQNNYPLWSSFTAYYPIWHSFWALSWSENREREREMWANCWFLHSWKISVFKLKFSSVALAGQIRIDLTVRHLLWSEQTLNSHCHSLSVNLL